MKKICILLALSLLFTGCKSNTDKNEEKLENCQDYGCFIGRIDNDVTHFNEYKYIAVELDEFTDTNIKRLQQADHNLLAYLSIGSLENYRDYYEEFEEYTFADYEEWPDERWLDVSISSWQEYVVNTIATDFKNRGAFGVYLDNVDVYTVAKEKSKNYNEFANGIKTIIEGINALGLKVMVNGGSEFLDDMNDKNDSVFSSIWAYHQEEIFSRYDFENETFKKQNKDDSKYYKEIASMMKLKGKEIFLLEYTEDNNLIADIDTFCKDRNYHYFVTNDIELK